MDDDQATTDSGQPEGHEHGGWAEPVDKLSADQKEASHKEFDASNAPEPGPGGETSKEDATGVSPDDTTGASALGVGESVNKSGESFTDKEPDDFRGTEGQDEGTVGAPPAAERTSINPQDPPERS